MSTAQVRLHVIRLSTTEDLAFVDASKGAVTPVSWDTRDLATLEKSPLLARSRRLKRTSVPSQATKSFRRVKVRARKAFPDDLEKDRIHTIKSCTAAERIDEAIANARMKRYTREKNNACKS